MRLPAALAAIAATPAAAATGPFFSLGNTNFVVLIAFIIFIGALIYFKAPHFVGRFLDGRIEVIRSQIENASQIRDDAAKANEEASQANEDSKQQAEQAVAAAHRDAELFVENARKTIEQTVERRLQAAEEQIASAEAAAVAGVRNEAISIAVEAAGQVISESMTKDDRRAMMNRAMEDLRSNLN